MFQGNLVLIFYTSRTPRNVSVCVCVYREGSERRMEERSPPLPADLLRWMKSRNGRVLREAGTGVHRVFFSSVSFIRVTFREIRERSFDPLFFVPLNLRRKKKVVQKF